LEALTEKIRNDHKPQYSSVCEEKGYTNYL